MTEAERNQGPASRKAAALAGLPKAAALAGLAVVLLVHGALALTSAAQKSVTVDELGHLPAGFYYLETGDPRYASLNPPLVTVLSALPVLALGLPAEPEPPPASDDPFSFWATGYAFLGHYHDEYVRIFSVARGVPVAMAALLGVLVFVWARRLAPQAPGLAGLLASGLVCLSPNVIAHARIVGTDVGTALFVALALFSFRSMLLRPEVLPTLACGLAIGLAQLTKFYSLLLVPTLPALAIAWHVLSQQPRPGLARLLGATAAALALSVAVLNSGYLWRDVGVPLSGLSLQSETLRAWQDAPLAQVPIPLPASYLRALDGQLVEVNSQIPSFLLGESFEGGRWYYYLALLAIKTPLPLFVALGVAVALALTAAGARLARRESLLLLAYPALLFVMLSLGDRRQLGARALLSAAPLVQIWVAVTFARSANRRWPALVAAASLAWILAVSLRAHPDYLAYFNPLVGGATQGYRYASDANVDIGQDLVKLADYLEEVDAGRVQLLYFGSVDPAVYGIDYEIPVDGIRPGVLAVSVSLYRMEYPTYDHGALRMVGPVNVQGLGEPVSIGGSIHVYHVPDRD